MDAASKLSYDDLHHDFSISHGSVFGTLAHMAGAEWIWLERWNGRSPTRDEAWPRWSTKSLGDLNILRARWLELVEKRGEFVSQLNEDQLKEFLEFKLLNGDFDSMRLVDQMQHVVNHATMHRGQVVGMIRQLGHEPPTTDLLVYLRQKTAAN
jgi:uncharacterized damage-inducible protein DinB